MLDILKLLKKYWSFILIWILFLCLVWQWVHKERYENDPIAQTESIKQICTKSLKEEEEKIKELNTIRIYRKSSCWSLNENKYSQTFDKCVFVQIFI